MPARSTSPEAAQKKLWKAEIKDLGRTRRRIVRDSDSEQNRLRRESAAANKALSTYIARRSKNEPRAVGDIDRRIGILKGRLGI